MTLQKDSYRDSIEKIDEEIGQKDNPI